MESCNAYQLEDCNQKIVDFVIDQESVIVVDEMLMSKIPPTFVKYDKASLKINFSLYTLAKDFSVTETARDGCEHKVKVNRKFSCEHCCGTLVSKDSVLVDNLNMNSYFDEWYYTELPTRWSAKKMSKTERRKLFQPIPLSSILDPTYQSPFSKLEKFKVDMDISHPKQPPQTQTVWQKLQSSLLSAMSNFVIMSTTSVSSISQRSSHSMSLVPLNTFKPCESMISEDISDLKHKSSESSANVSTPEKLYGSVRSGLQYLRYFATHPLQPNNDDYQKKSTQTQTPTRHYFDCRADISTMMLRPQVSVASRDKTAKPPSTKSTDGNFEIFFHSPSIASQNSNSDDSKSMNTSPSTTPEKNMSESSSPNKTTSSSGIGQSGCIIIETNWRNLGDESNSSLTNFQTRYLCSSSSTLKGSGYTISCGSASVSSPRAIMTPGRVPQRRMKTESESSTESYNIEISASVESTDSFCVVFESAIGDEDITREDDEEWEDEDEEDEDDSDDDDEDQIFNYSSTSDDIFVDGYIFQADGILDAEEGSTSCDQVDHCIGSTVRSKTHKAKTVSFDEEHLENVWKFEDDSESQNARKPYWEVLARDRARFQDRILRTGDILEPILSPNHRLCIYQKLFLNGEESKLKSS